MEESRIVLFPYGQPVAQDGRDACMSLVLGAGGDLIRVYDGPWDRDPTSAEAEVSFLRCISRIQEVVSGYRPPLVILTRTNPLPLAVLAKRRRICGAIKNLNRAAWIIFADPATDPFFLRNAGELGTFDVDSAGNGDQSAITVWTPSQTDDQRQNEGVERYVIWHSSTPRDKAFRKRMAELWDELDQIPIMSTTMTRSRTLTELDEPVASVRRRN